MFDYIVFVPVSNSKKIVNVKIKTKQKKCKKDQRCKVHYVAIKVVKFEIKYIKLFLKWKTFQ